ncbi:MAG: hypothetical protein H6Q72_4281 [Firmicutes bacterium]|nr:hypothetical protein [Bacillota bacterium]
MFLKAPEDCSACSVGGVEYPVKDGVVEVPDAVYLPLLDHGFMVTDKPKTVKADDKGK